MKTSQRCIAAIKSWEGFRECAHQDCVSVWTIGFGETFQVKAGDRVTEAEAAARLERRADELADAIQKLLDVPVTQGQLDSLVSFSYNLGLGSLRGSTLFKRLNQGDTARAAAEFPKWCHAGGREVPGLAKRRAQERDWFEHGEAA